MTTWGWKTPQGKPVFNFASEGRDFSGSDRVLVPATGFYEYTTPTAPKVKLKDRHHFTMVGEPWFWIAGIVKNDCFSLLTVAPGRDILPYHDRQIVTLRPTEGLHWLKLDVPVGEVLRSMPPGAFKVETLRKNGQPAAPEDGGLAPQKT
jgi:putative SOS response-associated peptidase YedK